MIGSQSVTFSISTWLQGRLTIELISQNVANNQSVYNAKLHISRKNSETFYYANTASSLYMTISGPGLSSSTTNRTYAWNISSSWVLIREQSVTVTHNADGTPPSSSFYGAITDSYQGWNGNGTVTYTFPTIPRASSFTLSGATQTNSNINVTISRASTSFTHRVRWKVGSGSWIDVASAATTSASFTVQPSNMANLKSATITVGVQTYNGTTAIGSETTATRTITIPNTTISLSGTAETGSTQTVTISNSGGSLTYTRSWSLGSATGTNSSTWVPPHSALPSATSGTLTCTVTTKNGTATINTVSATRTITVPTSVAPTFTSITHSEYVSNVNTLVGAYVQSKTRLTLGVTGAAAGSGSSIKSYSISVAGHTVGNGGTTPVITQSGTLTISATVTDNRNRTVTKTTTISVLAYENPIVTGVSFTRSNSDGTPNTSGTHLTIKATVRVRSLVVSSTEKNKINYQSQSAQSGGSYTTKTNLASQAGTVSGNYRQSVYTHTFSGYPVDYPYTVRVRGGDIFSWSGYIAGGIPTGVVLQHWGESTTAFGKMIDSTGYNVLVGSKGLQVDGPAEFKKGIKIPDTRSVVPQPQDLPSNAMSLDFKSNSSVGNPPVNASPTYSHIINVAGWNSNEGSGGWPTQISVGGSGIAVRQATSATTWGPWKAIGSPTLDMMYPVGAIYISTVNTNPSTLFGGTWVAFGTGRTIVGVDTSQTEFSTVEKTGGHKSLQSHSHTATTASGGAHTHTVSGTAASAGGHSHVQHTNTLINYNATTNGAYAYYGATSSPRYYAVAAVEASVPASAYTTASAGAHTHTVSGTAASAGAHSHTTTIASTGGGNAQNLQPYITVYMFKRTA